MNQRYVIEIREIGRGRRVVERLTFSDYDEAMTQLDSLESRYHNTCTVEFRDASILRR